jgi:glutamate-1-semialdehyde 2,1-aminomutase
MKRVLKHNQNRTVVKAAQHVLVGGVDSPVRSFAYIGGDPIPIHQGEGSRIYDYDGKEYIDYVLSYGAMILGHARPEITSRIKAAVDMGLGFGATHDLEVVLAERIRAAIPFAHKIRFVSSGTEAVMGAVRLARGATGRKKILKFEGAYHGHADYLLAKAGSGLSTLGLPASRGVPDDFVRHTLIAPYGDEQAIAGIFKEHGNDIAAVLVEPVGGNNGVVPPDAHFLKHLRAITQCYGALLIFDEIITGFRFHFGSAAAYFGVEPDLICLGKIIGGGLPIGAYGGSDEIMNHLAPQGGVYQASTFAGNPIVMQAGIGTLDILASLHKEYKQLNEMARYIGQALRNEADAFGIALSVRQFGSMFSIHFKKAQQFKLFYRALLRQGIYLAPSEYESNFLSFSHTQDDIDQTRAAARIAFRLLAAKGA